MTTQRPARPGDLCTCGRPATVVFLTKQVGANRLVRDQRRRREPVLRLLRRPRPRR